MRKVKLASLTEEERVLIDAAFRASRKSTSDLGHRIGCLVKCENGEMFLGATNIRSRSIGSTCAERMAVDQMVFAGNKAPKLCVLIGKAPSRAWRKNSTSKLICTPCGVCLEMFRQLVHSLNLTNLEFICSSWDKTRIVKTNLWELFPDPNKSGI